MLVNRDKRKRTLPTSKCRFLATELHKVQSYLNRRFSTSKLNLITSYYFACLSQLLNEY